MEKRKKIIHADFQKKVNSILAGYVQQDLSYDHDEFWMIQPIYEYLEYYAITNEFLNMALALPLARGLHDGAHRKLTVSHNGMEYKLPYAIHPLEVTRMLVDLDISMSHDELDILFATALCHDMIEDLDFKEGGKELYSIYHLDPQVYENVRYVSKRYDFTPEQEKAFFHNIETHKIPLLVKLSDRGNNVEDLYNMKLAKVYEYTGETDLFFNPMCEYGLENYPELRSSFAILKDKIQCLSNGARTLIIRYLSEEEELKAKIREQQEENAALRKEWLALWKEDQYE